MKNAIKFLLLCALIYSVSARAEDTDDITHRLNAAATDLDRLTNAPDKGIPMSVLANAKCVAIVPPMVKAGLIVGAEHGRGVATCRTDHGWSAPAFFTMTGGSWGPQIGVAGTDLVMLFMNHEGAKDLLATDLKIGADAEVAAGPWGRDASANTDVLLNTSILTYSRSKGVFVGASLNGSEIHADEHAIRLLYGQPYNFRDLLEGRVVPPEAAHPFLAQIRHNFHEAVAEK